MQGRVLLAAHPVTVASWTRELSHEACRLRVTVRASDALALVERERFDVLVLSAELGALPLAAAAHAEDPSVLCIVIGAPPPYEEAMQAMARGEVYRFLGESPSPGDLAMSLRGAMDARARAGALGEDADGGALGVADAAARLASGRGCVQRRM